MPDTTLRTPAGEVEAYLALPAGEGPWPGVVVLHELLGLNADIRAQADRFAARGYVALAPDLFSFRRPKAVCVLAAFRALARRSGPAFDAIEAARAALVARADATGRVGVIGFCMGGGFALLAAPSGGFAASSVNYGVVPRNPREVLRGACPVVGTYGGTDRMLRGAAAKLESALAANGVEHDVKEYPGRRPLAPQPPPRTRARADRPRRRPRLPRAVGAGRVPADRRVLRPARGRSRTCLVDPSCGRP